MSDTKKIRALKKVSGMQPGVIYDKPTKIADVLINGGHAVSADTLAERKASEAPDRQNPLADDLPITTPEAFDPGDIIKLADGDPDQAERSPEDD